MGGGLIEFELGLEARLRKLLDPVVASPAPRRTAKPRTVFNLRFATSMAAGLLLIAVGAEATITRSLNPVDWSRSVGQQITNANPASHHQSTTPAKHTTQASPAPSRPSAGQTPAIPKLSPLPIPTVTPPALPAVP